MVGITDRPGPASGDGSGAGPKNLLVQSAGVILARPRSNFPELALSVGKGCGYSSKVLVAFKILARLFLD